MELDAGCKLSAMAKSGGWGNRAGNDAGASLAVGTEAGALDVIFDVGTADAGACVGTGGALRTVLVAGQELA